MIKEGLFRELVLQARIENISRATDFINEQLKEYSCSVRTLSQIDIAIDELFSNIAQYTYDKGEGEVVIRFSYDDATHMATIVFIDQGIPFDPLKQEDPDISVPAKERKIGGLGIFLVKKIMDHITYHYEDGKNILTIKKKIS